MNTEFGADDVCVLCSRVHSPAYRIWENDRLLGKRASMTEREQWLSNVCTSCFSAHCVSSSDAQKMIRGYFKIQCLFQTRGSGVLRQSDATKSAWQRGKTTHLGVFSVPFPPQTMTKLRRSALSRFIIAHNGSIWTTFTYTHTRVNCTQRENSRRSLSSHQRSASLAITSDRSFF